MSISDVASLFPATATFYRDVVAGLSQPHKGLPCKYFYDETGSALFDRITELDEYYVTRAELEILTRHAGEIADEVGPRAAVIEYGSGSSVKTRFLLDALEEPVAYVPVDISDQHLLATANALRETYPGVPIIPLAADYSSVLTLPTLPPHVRRIVYFPGSTIGNLEHDVACDLLSRSRALVGPGGGLVIGIDLKKDPAVLELAYNDSAGITAAFNRNLLERINRELGADFSVESFEHRAVWNDTAERIEMYLVSSRPQTVTIDTRTFEFDTGEAIHTENSHKYTIEGFADLARAAGFTLVKHWEDDARYFSVQHFEARP
jgi:dimethylhistidine N-methyltransferase